MANPSKAKGTRWETEVTTYLRGWDLPARRVAQTGPLDVGDIHVHGFTLQAKDVATHDLAGWVDAAEAQAKAAALPFGVAVVKRRRRGTAQGYVVMSLETFARLATITYDPTFRGAP